MSLKREIDSPIIDFPPEKRVKSVGVQKPPREECLAFTSVKQEIVESPDPRCISSKSNLSTDKSFHKGRNIPSIKGIKQKRKDNPMSSGRFVTSDISKGTPLDSRARGTLPGTSAQAYTEPKDMVCDFCLNQKVSAVKTCLTCSCSYCEIHVMHHYTVPALQKHVLAEVSGDRGHVGKDQRGHMDQDQRGHMDQDQRGHKDQNQRGHTGTAGTPRTSRGSETVKKYPKKKKSGLSELEMMQNRIKKLEKKNRKLKKSNLVKEVIQLKLENDALNKENTKLKQEASFGSKNMSIQECTGRACLQKERGSRTNPRNVDDYSRSGDELGKGSEEDDSQSEDLEASQDESEEGDLNEEENDYDDDDDIGLDEEASQGQNDDDYDDDDDVNFSSDYEDDDDYDEYS